MIVVTFIMIRTVVFVIVVTFIMIRTVVFVIVVTSIMIRTVVFVILKGKQALRKGHDNSPRHFTEKLFVFCTQIFIHFRCMSLRNQIS